MKIKFNSHDNLPLNKILKLHNSAMLSNLFFKKKTNIMEKFLDEYLYEF